MNYGNFLQIEQSDIDNHRRVWGAIRDRAQAEGRAQIVHMLFHHRLHGATRLGGARCAVYGYVPKAADGVFVGAEATGREVSRGPAPSHRVRYDLAPDPARSPEEIASVEDCPRTSPARHWRAHRTSNRARRVVSPCPDAGRSTDNAAGTSRRRADAHADQKLSGLWAPPETGHRPCQSRYGRDRLPPGMRSSARRPNAAIGTAPGACDSGRPWRVTQSAIRERLKRTVRPISHYRPIPRLHRDFAKDGASDRRQAPATIGRRYGGDSRRAGSRANAPTRVP